MTYLLLIIVVMGCERSRPSAQRFLDQDLSILVVGPATVDYQWPYVQRGALGYARGTNHMRIETTAPPAATRLRDVEVLLESPRHAVVLWVDDPPTAEPLAQSILDHGCVLVTIGSEIDITGLFGHVNIDSASAAALLGKNLKSVTAPRRSYLLLHEDGRDPLATQCYQRFVHVASRQFAVMMLAEANAYASPRSTSDLLDGMLNQFRHAGLIISLMPDVWISSPADDIEARDIRFATVSAVPELWYWIETGKATALAGPLDGDIGRTAVEIAIDGVTGDGKAIIRKVVPSEFVTADNLSDFARRYREAADLDLEHAPPFSAESTPAPSNATDAGGG